MIGDDFLFNNESQVYYASSVNLSEAPSVAPSSMPLSFNSSVPSTLVTFYPTLVPSNMTVSPTLAPTSVTTNSPTNSQPSMFPTSSPTDVPTISPTIASTTAITYSPTPGVNITATMTDVGSHRHTSTQITLIVLGLFVMVCILIALILRFNERKDRTAARRSNIRYAEYLGEDFEGDESSSTKGLVQMPVSAGSHAGTWARPSSTAVGGGRAGGDVPTAIGVIGQSVRRTKYSVMDPSAIDKPDATVTSAAAAADTDEEQAEQGGEWSRYQTSNPMNPFK